MQGQADGGVGVQGDGEVAGQQVAGAGGDESHGHLGAGQLGGDGAHGAVAAGHHDQVDAGLQGAAGHGAAGVVGGGLQPDGGQPAGGADLGGDPTAQEREVVELGGVVDDGGALLAAGARQAAVDPAGEDRVDAADPQGEVREGGAQEEAADEVAERGQAHVPLADGGHGDGRVAQEGAGGDHGAAVVGAREGHQDPGGQGHRRDVRVGVGVLEGGDGVGEGGARGGAGQVQGDEVLRGDTGGGDGQRDAQAAHAGRVGVGDPGHDEPEDEEGVGEGREGLGELAGGRPQLGVGGRQEGVDGGGAVCGAGGERSRGAQVGPHEEGQGEADAQDGLDVLQASGGSGGGGGGGGGGGVAWRLGHARSSFPLGEYPGVSLAGAPVGGICPGCGWRGGRVG